MRVTRYFPVDIFSADVTCCKSMSTHPDRILTGDAAVQYSSNHEHLIGPVHPITLTSVRLLQDSRRSLPLTVQYV